ncbi:MAG: peptidase M16, partial [Rhodospirillaceae bacterium]
FYKANYAPDNAILIVAGDVDSGEVKRLAEKYYGVIDVPPAQPRRNLVVSNAAIKGGETILKDARVSQAVWSQSIIQPSLTNGDARRVTALEVLSEILGGGSTARLYRALVIDQKLALNSGTYYDSGARGEGRFVFYASPRPGVDLDTVAKAVEAEKQRLLTDGFKAGELDRLKTRMLSGAIFARDEMKAGAMTLGASLAPGHSVADIEDWPQRLEDVTEQDVLDALKAVITEPRQITTKLLPKGADE